ncbi:MAG: peptidase E [Candidatus Sericytochromatia bacterium]|nr:peptidase E [Candidatus Sericytochromatia bacterium]
MKQIIAMGGGGFSMEPENPLLDQYILAQSSIKSPKICFLGTASGDSDSYIERFYSFFNSQTCEPSHLSLFRGHTDKIEEFILSQNIIYVGGGNTRNLMVLWKEWNLDKILRKAYDNKIILCGISAGSLCWFEEGLTDSVPNQLNKIECLGFLSGSNCPHFDGESNRKPRFKELIKLGVIKSGIGADDGVALHYVDDHLSKIVSSRPNAMAYQIYDDQEEVIKPQYLG